MFGQSLSVGQHVVLGRDVDAWLGPLGYPAAKRGTRAIVRERPSGFFSDRYVVELTTGRRLSISGRQLKPAVFGGHGDEAWWRYKANRAGVRIGMALSALPAVFQIVRFYLAGGTTAELVASLPGAVLGLLGDAIAVADRFDLMPLLALGLVAVLVMRRLRSR